ncbi:TRAP transporter small permease subunit [Reyranella sp.]|uniref:TRAP transporter small permease subunit n=1 Tax=Reyranella sp. TaxID=1929291 RepID=UPI00120FA37B|nr:TRAP transporter small permease [Reyranella sp.]TAJ82448.1 MAG: TRAP transporter small permease [Reyranella sp.]
MPGDGTTALAVAHRYWSRLEDGMNLIAAAAIFFLMFVGVFQIIGRTAFNTAIYGYIDYMEQASALFAFLGISYAQRVGAHIRMDLLLRGFSLRFLWSMELFAVLVAMLAITTLIDSTWQNFLRAYQLGDSTIDIKLPVWPTKLLVPFVLAVLWVRLALQAADYARLIRFPNAAPIAVPVIETIEVQAQNEIQEALGREEKTAGEKRP